MNTKLYEILKWIALIVLPALATFYATLATQWDWNNADTVVATIVTVDTLLGACLKKFPAIDGVAYVQPSKELDDPDKFVLHLNGDPAELQNQKTVRLQVKKKAA